MADLSILTRPFTDLKSRKGADGKQFSYVPGGDILDRIIEATQGIYDFEIIDLRYVEGATLVNKKTGETYTSPAVWMIHGRLTMPGLGSRDAVGTAVALNEDAVKSAETDAIKRCAVKFGVALHLYRADEGTPTANGAAAGGAHSFGKINDTGAQCVYCRVAHGSRHRGDCPSLNRAAA